MNIETIVIGATPCEEECAQVGRADYSERSRRECLVFQRMLERLHPAPNAEAWLEVKSFAHDFGRHREVCVCFNEQDEAACHYANRLEREMPARWDAIAIYELLWHERKERFSCAVVRGEIDDVPVQYRSTDFPALPADKTFPELCRMFPL